MQISPCTVKEAKKMVALWHRHLPRIHGGLFAAAVVDGSTVVGVGIVGCPPPSWQGSGRCVISRVATTGLPNVCSMLYGALSRAAKALGYREVWTYTLASEPGTSLRAAGFKDMGMTDGRADWSRPNIGRIRKVAQAPGPKRRWRRTLRHETTSPSTTSPEGGSER